MSGRKIDVDGLRKLRSGGVLWPVSLVARVGGVSAKRVYDLHERGNVRLVCVQGYLFADVDALLRWFSRCEHTEGGACSSVAPSAPVCSLRSVGLVPVN